MPRKRIVVAPLVVRIPFESAEERGEFELVVEKARGKTTGGYVLDLIRKDIRAFKRTDKREGRNND